MSQSPRAIIILEYHKDKMDTPYGSSLQTLIEQEKRHNDVIFSVDNHSDSLTVHYAKKLMEESGLALIVCALEQAEHLGALQQILNYAIKRKNTILISMGSNPLLKPFMTFKKGEVIHEDVEIIRILKSYV